MRKDELVRVALAGVLLFAAVHCGSTHELVDASGADAGRRDADRDAPSADAGRQDAGADASGADDASADADRSDAELLDGGGADADTGVDADVPTCGAVLDSLDLLFVIDNSHTMDEEQAALRAQLPRLMRALTSGQLLDASGAVVRTSTAIGSLQVGIVDTDMGTGGHLVPTCAESDIGDDGILRTQGTSIAGCDALYPRFLQFPDGMADSGGLAQQARCVMSGVGAEGCGFEQPLDAMLKAVTPSSSSTTFVLGSSGHGDGVNDGFLRNGSAFGVILLTSEDDCSASDGGLFDFSSTVYVSDANLRCWKYPEALYPLARYRDGLLALRPAHPERLVYSVIAGVPADLVSAPLDYDTILTDPRMQPRPDPMRPSILDHSCNVEGVGLAEPPVRLTTLARELRMEGVHATIQSICQADLTQPIDAIIHELFDAMEGRCPR